MSTLRSKTKQNAIRCSKQYTGGTYYTGSGQMVKPYKQGYDSYFGGLEHDIARRIGGQFFLGWQQALESDKKLHTQTSHEHVQKRIEHRIHIAFGLVA